MPETEITIEATGNAAEHEQVQQFVLRHLREFNRERAVPPDFEALSLGVRDGDALVGGLVGEIGWQWLFVELLWMAESHRGRGLGGSLLQAAEAAAVRRGARHVYLDTFDFQARPFYERQGYEVFGVLEDYPPGHRRFFLRKDLVHASGAQHAETTLQEDPSEILDRSWDDNARAWLAAVREGRIESRRVATDRAIVNAVLQRSPTRVLDVGCGEGWLCRTLREHGISCVGIDGSHDLVRAAQSADPEGEYHVLRYDDFERLPRIVKPAPTDVAVCNFALLHEDIGAILANIHDVLRPRGTLVIQTVHPWTARGASEYVDGWRTEEFAWSVCRFPRSMPWYFRTLESWLRTIGAGGFVLDGLTEPAHPESGMPLSLLLSAVRPGPMAAESNPPAYGDRESP